VLDSSTYQINMNYTYVHSQHSVLVGLVYTYISGAIYLTLETTGILYLLYYCCQLCCCQLPLFHQPTTGSTGPVVDPAHSSVCQIPVFGVGVGNAACPFVRVTVGQPAVFGFVGYRYRYSEFRLEIRLHTTGSTARQRE
jgi:hypothetical protein